MFESRRRGGGQRNNGHQQRLLPLLFLLILLSGLICLYQFYQLGFLHYHRHEKRNSDLMVHQQNLLLPDYPLFENENENDYYDNIRDDDNKNNKNNNNNDFSACLLVMDDNHFLIEWLAYHYTVLPLRRLIIAKDPRSITSPISILSRYNDTGLINITLWDDDDYIHPVWKSSILLSNNNNNNGRNENNQTQSSSSSVEDRLTALHRLRQRFFFNTCMKALKNENRSWVVLIDTDEFLTPNYNWEYNFLLPLRRSSSKSKSKSKIITIAQLLDRFSNYKTISLSSKCIGLPRLLFGTKEEEEKEEEEPSSMQQQQQQQMMLLLNSTTSNNNNNNNKKKRLRREADRRIINRTDFLTLRWLWHAPVDNFQYNKIGKSLIDVSKVPLRSFRVFRTDVHRPIKAVCNDYGMWIQNKDSPFVVHHYIGTYEQYFFRFDPRNGTRTYSKYDSYKNIPNSRKDDDTTTTGSWINSFIESMGPKLASKLLANVGRVEVNNVNKTMMIRRNATADMEMLLDGLPDLALANPVNVTRIS